MEDGNSRAAAGRRRVVLQVERVASLEARIAALHAAQVSVLADLQVDPHVDDHGIDLVDELAPRLRWTSFTAARRLVTADRVASCFPLLLEELTGGEVDYHRVDVVVREAELLDEEQALVLDAVLAGRLPGLTTTQIKDLVRREISVIDSDAVKERARRVVAGRRAGFTSLPGGQALLELLGPAPALRAVYDRLDALAKDVSRPGAGTDPYAGYGDADGSTAPAVRAEGPTQGIDDPRSGVHTTDVRGIDVRGIDVRGTDIRSIDAKRFDAAVEMVLAPVAGAPGVATGTGPQITVAWSAATGLDDGPAHLAGHGAVPAELVRHLLRSRGFRCVATDPVTGHVVAADGHVHPTGSLPHRDDLLRAVGWFDASSSPERRIDARSVTPTSRAHGVAAPPTVAPGVHVGPFDSDVPEWGPSDGRAAWHDADRDDDHDGSDGASGPHEPTTPEAESGPVLSGATIETVAPEAPARPVPSEAPIGSVASDRPDGSHRAGERDAPGEADDPGASDPPAPSQGALQSEDAGDPGRTEAEEDALAIDRVSDDPTRAVPQDEFAVTLDISRLRAATLVNPVRVDDVEDWRRRAERRARSAVARCPVTASPVRPYRFPAAVRRLLVARSPTCAAPGCRAPAQRCDLDHTVEFSAGGPTCPCNAAPLCRRHHTARHDRGWLVIRSHDDPRDPTLTWMSPLGYVYTAAPDPLVPPVSHHVVEHLAQRRRSRAALRRELARRPVITGSAHTGVPATGRGTGAGTETGLKTGADARTSGGAGTVAAAAVPPHAPDHAWDRDCVRCDPFAHRLPRPEAAGGPKTLTAPAAEEGTTSDADLDEPPF